MRLLAFLTGAALIAATLAPGAQEARLVTIGTGGVAGVYYPVGAAICRQVNRHRQSHGLRCQVEATGGSLANIARLADGTLDFGIVQSDVQYAAYHGEREFADAGPMAALRAVLTLHSEPFTLVARPDAGIASFADLAGKRVNIGNPGSGQRNTMTKLMEELGWTTADFALATELESSRQAEALCDGEIDAFVFTVGHPSGSITEATEACGAVLVPVTGEAVDRLVAGHAYYRDIVIPGGIYAGNAGNIATFGGSATLVTTTDAPNELVEAVVEAVFDDIAGFTKLHPALAPLDGASMAGEGRTAPLHPGAERYFIEHGLM